MGLEEYKKKYENRPETLKQLTNATDAMKKHLKEAKETLKKDKKDLKKVEKAVKKNNKPSTYREKDTCTFQCFKETEWGKQFQEKRTMVGVEDSIAASQLTASMSTKVCGFPVLKKTNTKKKECETCEQLSCLVAGRMACYAFSCKSPYVAVNGKFYYVPKTVLVK